MLHSAATLATRRDTRPMPRDPRWLTAQQAADVMQISRFTMWRMLKQGRLPDWVRTFKPSATTYYWREDIERLAREAHNRPMDSDQDEN